MLSVWSRLKRFFSRSKPVITPPPPVKPLPPAPAAPAPQAPVVAKPLSIQAQAYVVAMGELARGVFEVPGSGNNPRIVAYHAATDMGPSPDSVPWCSSFMNYCFKVVGGKRTKDAMARSWLNWGVAVESPQVGDVVVFKRGNDGYSGHVGFVAEVPGLSLWVQTLGGNEDDQVKIKGYLRSSVLGYRRHL